MYRILAVIAMGFAMITAPANSEPEHLSPGDNPATDAAGQIFAPALQGGSSDERANRIYEQNVDRKLEHIENTQGEAARLREEQKLRKEYH
jgi:hypothetical protein